MPRVKARVGQQHTTRATEGGVSIRRCSNLLRDVLSRFRRIGDDIWNTNVDAERMPSQRLTVMGIALVEQYAGVAARCFSRDLRYAGLALDRCLYEAIARTFTWMTDPKLAKREWAALPAFAWKEELNRVGGDESKMPLGVVRNGRAFRLRDPEAFEIKLGRLQELQEKAFKGGFGASNDQLRADWSAHVAAPSLAIHARPLVAEDFFEMRSDGLYKRESGIWFKPEARLLEITRLVLLLAESARAAYGLTPKLENLWRRFWSLDAAWRNAQAR